MFSFSSPSKFQFNWDVEECLQKIVLISQQVAPRALDNAESKFALAVTISANYDWIFQILS